jgi:hypothetical protein
VAADIEVVRELRFRGELRMNSHTQKHSQLLTLMGEALGTCILLRDFTDESYELFLGDDDNNILEAVQKREKIVENLINLKCQIDMILEEVAEYANGASLPDDVAELRQSVRSILSEVSKKDIEVMKLISGRMQKYRNETLRARNKKHLSAYMKKTFSNQPGVSVDYSK